MIKRSNVARYQSPSRLNGLKYDKDYDFAIIASLARSKYLSSGKLKEGSKIYLNRALNDRTYFNHLTRLVDKKILKREDRGQRGKISVFYSLTEETIRRMHLRLLKEIDPEYESFRIIYGNLLLKAITEGQIYGCGSSNLDELLSQFHMSRKDLIIDYIKKERFNGNLHARYPDNPAMRILPDVIVIHYKPILNLVGVTEEMTYRKNIKTNHIYEDDSYYEFSIPGISIKEFNQRFSDFKAKPGHVATAFEQLLKNGIIQPIMKFRDEIRYVLADYKLFYLIKDIRTIFDLDSHFNAMGQQFCPPAYEEKEKRKVWYTDDVSVNKFFNTRELYRDAIKKQIKKNRGTKEFICIKHKVQSLIKEYEEDKTNAIKCIREKHRETLEKYSFLSDVIGIEFPLLFQ